jgi:hypothetical protein
MSVTPVYWTMVLVGGHRQVEFYDPMLSLRSPRAAGLTARSMPQADGTHRTNTMVQ